MLRLATWKDVKQVVMRGLFATALTALIVISAAGISAAGASQSWSVVVHIEYDNGFVYEHAFATGVLTSDLPAILEACGSAHRWNQSVVRYHCYPVPE
jgi:hypothetical protein